MATGVQTGATLMPAVADGVVAAPVQRVSRLIHIDGGRGLLLAMMYLAHSGFGLLGGEVKEGLLNLYIAKHLPVAEANFFILLSGFVCALAYRGVFDRGGVRQATITVLKRLRWLYLYQIIVAASIVLVVLKAPPVRAGVIGQSVFEKIAGVLTFVNQPRNLDILLLYIVLMLFIPLALALLTSGRKLLYWSILVALWITALLGIDVAAVRFINENIFPLTDYIRLAGKFDPLSYAILFYGGFFLGNEYRQRGRDFSGSFLPPNTLVFVGAVLTFVTFIVLRHTGIMPELEEDRVRWTLSVRSTVIVCSITYVFYYLLNRHDLPKVLSWPAKAADALLTFKPFVLLGQNSLFVYSLHVLVVAGFVLVARHPAMRPHTALTLAFFSAGYAVIFIATSLKRRYLPALP